MSNKAFRRHKYRAFLFVYQKGRCAYCLRQMKLSFDHEYTGGNLATLDHVIPASKNGKTTWENLVLCCSSCNHSKDNKEIPPVIPTLKLINRNGEFKTYRGLGGQKFTTDFMKEVASRIYGANESYAVETSLYFPIDLVQSTVSQPCLHKRG